jgi:NADH-quinone oxidoreductase subunit G
LNEGARVARVKPRYNPDVNQWWLCDEGRYGLGWIDHARLDKVFGPAVNTPTALSAASATWEQALTAISTALAGARIGVIASAQLTNEELFLVRKIFRDALGARVSASVPQTPGSSDDFLIKADKNPNTLGATLLGLAGPDAPSAAQIVDDALAGNLDVLWVMGHDLVELFGEPKVRLLSEKVGLFVFSGANHNATVPFAHWVLPTAAYVEKDGTFVNCHGRVQRIGLAFPPLKGSREDWRILLELAAKLGLTFDGLPLDGQSPEKIFLQLAQALPPFEGLSYQTIGAQGIGVEAARFTPGVPIP